MNSVGINELKAEGLGFVSGTANQKSKTILEGKVKIVEKQKLPQWMVDSYLNGEYTTYETTSDVVLYRAYGMGYNEGSGATKEGAFATTEYSESRLDVKIRLALKPSWKNTRLVEEKIVVPPRQIISVGIVAPVVLETGTVLKGGAEQVLLPQNWPQSWVVGYREITSKPLQTYPEFYLNRRLIKSISPKIMMI